jgi:predicted small lipoprotein YifL
MKSSCGSALSAALLAALAATGCGLKGPLTMPSTSDEVVIRAQGQTAPTAGETTAAPTAGDTTAAPATGDTTATPPTPAPPGTTDEIPARKRPRDDRIPPPPLPGGNPGTARGG